MTVMPAWYKIQDMRYTLGKGEVTSSILVTGFG
jgi:hypothetical protein